MIQGHLTLLSRSLSYKKIRAAATKALPSNLCSEATDVKEVHCKIYLNWQPLKIQQKGQLLLRLLPWWCEPFNEVEGRRQRRKLHSMSATLESGEDSGPTPSLLGWP